MISAISRTTSTFTGPTHSPTVVSNAFQKLFDKEWVMELIMDCAFDSNPEKIERLFREISERVAADDDFTAEEKELIQDFVKWWRYETALEMGQIDQAVDAFLVWNKNHEGTNYFKEYPSIERMRGLAFWIQEDEEQALSTLSAEAEKGDPLSFALLKAFGAEVPRFEGSILNPGTIPWVNEYKAALSLFFQGQYDAAIAACDEMLQKYPTEEPSSDAVAFYDLRVTDAVVLKGYCYLMKQDYQMAAQVFDGYSSRGILNEEAAYGLALANRFLGLPTPSSTDPQTKVILRLISLI